MMVLLVHSKSKASISASRSRGSANFWPPRVDEPALRAGRRVVRQHVALDAAVLERRKIVARRPGARGEFLAEQIILGGEAFEADVAVAIVFVAHGCRNCSGRGSPADRRPTSPSRARIRCSGRPRSGRPCRGPSRAARRASIPRTASSRNRRARRSAARRRTAARRARVSARSARSRSRRRSPRRRQSRAAAA